MAQATDKDKKDLEGILDTFCNRARTNFDSALKSGAIAEEELAHMGMVAKVVINITADGFRPLSKEGKALLKNLKNFI